MRNWRMLLGFLVFLLIWAGLNSYVFYRIAGLPWVNQHIPRWAIALIGLALASSYIVGRILSRHGVPAGTLEAIGGDWVGVAFLCVVCLLAADIVTGFGFLVPRWAISARSIALLAAVVLSAIAFVQALRPPVVTEYEVKMHGLPASADGTVMVVASDLHLGKVLGPRWFEERVQQIESLHPDLIVLAGDILEGDEQVNGELLPALRKLTAPNGVYAVTGNHEYYAGADACVRLLQSAGVRVLRDEWAEAKPGLLLVGVDDLTARVQHSNNGFRADATVHELFAKRPAHGSATVFLSHTPWQAEDAAQSGAGLMVSGHTHNGQIWPFKYIVQTRYKLLAGRYDVNGMTAIVCRGTGLWGPRMRLWQRGELLRITLRSN